MNKIFPTLVIICFFICAYQPHQSCAADMGEQLKLKDDSKQELKEVMKQVKTIVNNYNFEFPLKKYPEVTYKKEQTFEFSGCKIQYYEKNFDDKKIIYDTRKLEFSLRDMETVDVSDNTDLGNNRKVVMKTTEFEKKVFYRWESYDLRKDGENYADQAWVYVSNNNVTTIVALFEKAIKLCADK